MESETIRKLLIDEISKVEKSHSQSEKVLQQKNEQLELRLKTALRQLESYMQGTHKNS